MEKYQDFIEFCLLAVLVFITPFLVIWGAYLCTGFAFDPKQTFDTTIFWIVSSMWWIIGTMATAIWLEESSNSK